MDNTFIWVLSISATQGADGSSAASGCMVASCLACGLANVQTSWLLVAKRDVMFVNIGVNREEEVLCGLNTLVQLGG